MTIPAARRASWPAVLTTRCRVPAGVSGEVLCAQAEARHETFGFTPAKLSGPAATVTAIVLALAQLGPPLPK
jgi:hypothetical protein